jgi:D-glycero-D-manno-heptose 1,7-bisphosphate phosphatase
MPDRRRGRRPDAVLFDRDGTLIVDVPYNGDPALVRPMPGARQALALLRSTGTPVAVVSNQSGVAHGFITERDVRAVNARAEELLGPVRAWLFCPHGPGEGCPCRKPAPGLVLRAAELLGVAPERCAVVGDIAADVQAAAAAGARGVLVPTGGERAEHTAHAPEAAPDLLTAVRALIGTDRGRAPARHAWYPTEAGAARSRLRA